MDLVTPGLGLFFWQTVTFLIVLFCLSKFAWKPIMGSLKEREQTIESALLAAEKAKQDIALLQAQNENLLKEARMERDKILKDAYAAASSVVEEAKDKARIEGDRLIEGARTAIVMEKNAALAEVKNYAATLSIDIAEKLLRKELSSDLAQKQLVSEYIKEANLN